MKATSRTPRSVFRRDPAIYDDPTQHDERLVAIVAYRRGCRCDYCKSHIRTESARQKANYVTTVEQRRRWNLMSRFGPIASHPHFIHTSHMSETDLTETEFLRARIAEDEHMGQNALVLYAPGSSGYADHYNPARVLAECEAKRRIIALHESWPTLVETPLETETMVASSSTPANDIDGYVLRASKQIAWLTTREYVARFGMDPPTAPMIHALSAIYADHEDYRPEWAP